MMKNWPNPMVFAHRGASVNAPENTIASFKLAKTLNADAVEFDVKLTSDRQVVIIHDATVNRTTNGTGKVSDLSLAEIKQLDAGSKFNEKYAGEKIPTLREVFETFGDQLRFNIELTNYKTPLDGLIFEVKKLIDEFKLKESIIFSSFNPMNLSLAKNLMPEIDCGLLTFPGTLGKLSMLLTNKKSYQAVHPNVADVNEKLVSTIHSQGKRVHVWTVNDKEKMKELLGLGVDGIFTDNPEELKSLLEFHE